MAKKKSKGTSESWLDIPYLWMANGNIVTTIITDRCLDVPGGDFVQVDGGDIYPKVGRSIQRPDGSWATLIVQFPEV